MLLGIAIANLTTAWLLLGSGPITTAWEPDGPADVIVGVFNAMVVHQRGLPMFSTLLGYGIGMLLTREASRETPFPTAKSLIMRRYLWLAAFGLVHAVFLFYGDILLIYGILGFFIAVLMLQASDKTLLTWAAVLYGLIVVGALLALASEVYLRTMLPDLAAQFAAPFPGDIGEPGFLAQFGYLTQVVLGLLTGLSTIFGGFIGYFLVLGPVMLVGFVAARRGILENAEDHVPLLRRVGLGGIAVSLAGGLAVGLMTMGLLGPKPWVFAPAVLSFATGLPGGVAAVALVALWCRTPQRRIDSGEAGAGAPFDQLRALGQRSLSGYLFQSIVFIATLPTFTLGLIDRLTIATGTAYAAGVWAVSAVLAWLLDRAGKPGPAEWLHRRLAYGRPQPPAAATP